MSKCVISPLTHVLSGEITASPSKSQTLRAILFATIAAGTSKIDNVLLSPDAQSMIAACRQLGATITDNNLSLSIEGVAGNLRDPDDIISAGNSGIVLRFITAISGNLNNYCVITGDESIRSNRPIKPLLNAMSTLGVLAKSMRGDGYAPVIIKGPVLYNSTTLDGQDSQPVSGLIISSLLTDGETEINVEDPGEKPWLDLTLDWLDRLGLKYQRDEYNQFIIPGKQAVPCFDYYVPSDLSSISFPVAIAVLTGSNITINNVDLSDPQGDKIFLDILEKMGANIDYQQSSKKLVISKSDKLVGIDVDINNCIDVVNILSVVACFAEGKMTISGATIARSKECDRIACISHELKQMGARIDEFDDGLTVYQSQLKPSQELHTYNDHRMVMALFVACVAASYQNDFSQDSVILETKSIAKSYPEFFNDMKLLGCSFQRCT